MTKDRICPGLLLVCALVACGGVETPSRMPTLRVGTTGDIPPFSERTTTGYRGIDIELAHDLARELGRRAEFVATTWNDLIGDTRSGRFDVAMSGLMIVPARATSADFSVPYYRATHIVAVRCDDQERFSTLEQLDQTGVVVFARKGASSARNALRWLSHAEVRQVTDIGAAHRWVLEGRGEALLTMSYAIHQYPNLCLGLDGTPLYSADVGILMPQDSPLMEKINVWLARRLRDGTVRDLVRQYNAP